MDFFNTNILSIIAFWPLAEYYWEFRYDYTRLRSQVSRLDPDTARAPEAEPPAAPASVSFVPLSSMKKKDK